MLYLYYILTITIGIFLLIFWSSEKTATHSLPLSTFLKNPLLYPVNKEEVIPKIIFQTYADKTKIPQKVYNNLKQYAMGYKHYIYDDADCIQFLRTYYDEKVVNKFINISSGAHKADLFRYCILYIYGGIYLDIKSELMSNVDKIFTECNTIYTVISCIKGTVYQGIIATPPKNIFFLKLIKYIVENPDDCMNSDYHVYTKDFYQQILHESKSSNLKLGRQGKFYLFEEKCTSSPEECYDGLDRHGICSNIFDGKKKIIKTRYSDFPWKN